MGIEAVEVPTRSRLWTDQDAKQAYDLLTGDEANGVEPQAAKFGVYPMVDKDGNALGDDASKEAQKKARERAESKARTQGLALDRIIKERHGRRFGVSVWFDQEGNAVGALLPREPIQRKAEDKADETPKAEETPKRGRKRS